MHDTQLVALGAGRNRALRRWQTTEPLLRDVGTVDDLRARLSGSGVDVRTSISYFHALMRLAHRGDTAAAELLALVFYSHIPGLIRAGRDRGLDPNDAAGEALACFTTSIQHHCAQPTPCDYPIKNISRRARASFFRWLRRSAVDRTTVELDPDPGSHLSSGVAFDDRLVVSVWLIAALREGLASGRLRPRDVELLWLRHAEGWATADLDAVMGLSSQSSRMLCSRARRRAVGVLAA